MDNCFRKVKINYKLYAKVLEAKNRDFLPSRVTINYDLLGKVLEAKYNGI